VFVVDCVVLGWSGRCLGFEVLGRKQNLYVGVDKFDGSANTTIARFASLTIKIAILVQLM
jgi:hypothetical protein